MSIRDAQEQVRVLNAALRNSADSKGDFLQNLSREVADVFAQLAQRPSSDWKNLIDDRERTVGLMLLSAFGVANILEVDGHEALNAVLHSESP